MREKFLTYLHQIGLRYAIHYAKYEGVSLALCELWLSSDLATIAASAKRNEYDRQLVKLHYINAPAKDGGYNSSATYR